MSIDDRELSKEERNRLFVERMKAAAERNSVQARAEEWRDATPERHAEVLAQVIALADEIVRSRGFPIRKPPLPVIKMRNSRIPELRL